MAVAMTSPAPRGTRSLAGSLDLDCAPEAAFELLCAVEKWPLWLGFLRSARLVDPRQPLGTASEILVRAQLPGEEEQLFEVEHFVANYRLSLVGAYSVRRRLEFRIEQKTTRSRLHVRVTYPAYHGRLGFMLDGVLYGRKVAGALDHALEHFKGLVEYRRGEGDLLEDF